MLTMQQKRWTMVISGILGIIFYFLLPASYKIFSFLIPAVGLSFAFSKAGFNYPILLLLGIVFLLFPSSIFTLDSSNPYDIEAIRSQNMIDNTINTLVSVFCFGLPLILVLGGIWAIIQGNPESGVSALSKAAMLIIVVGVFITVLSWFGIPLGPFNGVAEFFNTLMDYITRATVKIQTTVDTWLNGSGSGNGEIEQSVCDSAKTEEVKEACEWLASQDKFNLDVSTLNPQNGQIQLIIIGGFPLNLSLFNIIIALISMWFKLDLPKFDFDTPMRISRPSNINYEFLIFLAIILVAYFTYYLVLGDSLFMTYRTLGFFTIYLTIITASCIILAFGFGSVVKTNWQTLLGILFGNVSLFIIFNLFTQATTLDAYGQEYSETELHLNYILVQFIAVGPAESFLFHIFIPALCLSLLLLQIKRYNNKELDQEISQIRLRVSRLDLENSYYQLALIKPKQNYKQEGGNIDDYIERISEINRLNNRIAEIERTKEQEIEPNIKYLSNKQRAIFVVVVVLSNFLFAIMHWFNSGMDFRLFWASGLGLIYFLSGIVITTISFRYGWLAGILTHAINNSAQIFLILIAGAI